MFTGIIEEVGKLKAIKNKNNLVELTVACNKVLEGSKYGDSIATNGVCLTVTELGPDYFKAEIMPESMEQTNFSKAKIDDRVNLERALAANGRLDGHLVQGHVDGIGTIRQIINSNNKVEYIIEADEEVLDFIVHKGSVCLDGISLTVSEVGIDFFKVSIIPTTLKETVLLDRKEGDYLNIETDILGRYILKMLTKTQMSENKIKITRDFLLENGF